MNEAFASLVNYHSRSNEVITTITLMREVVASLVVSLAIVPAINLLLDICDKGLLTSPSPKISSHLTLCSSSPNKKKEKEIKI
jgi:hypothetical protein